MVNRSTAIGVDRSTGRQSFWTLIVFVQDLAEGYRPAGLEPTRHRCVRRGMGAISTRSKRASLQT
eukprot:8646301-Pyramimonas_sp.AAC.1